MCILKRKLLKYVKAIENDIAKIYKRTGAAVNL